MKQKKQYQKPTMKVFELRQQHLLVGSNGDGGINPMGYPENI